MKHNNNNNSQLINGQCKDTKFPFIGELSILDRCNSQLINGQCKDTKFPFIGELSILDRCNFVYNIFSINDVLDDLVNSD